MEMCRSSSRGSSRRGLLRFGLEFCDCRVGLAASFVAEASLLVSLEPQLSPLPSYEWPDKFEKRTKEVKTVWDVRVLIIPELKEKLAPLAEVPGVALPPILEVKKVKKARAPRRPLWLHILVSMLCMFWLLGVLGTQRGPVDMDPGSASMAQLSVPKKFKSVQLQLRGETRRGVGSPAVDRLQGPLYRPLHGVLLAPARIVRPRRRKQMMELPIQECRCLEHCGPGRHPADMSLEARVPQHSNLGW